MKLIFIKKNKIRIIIYKWERERQSCFLNDSNDNKLITEWNYWVTKACKKSIGINTMKTKNKSKVYIRGGQTGACEPHASIF